MSGVIGGLIGSLVRGFTATGGAIVQANGYQHHIFTSSGTFSISQARNLTILVQDGGQTGFNGGWGTYQRCPWCANAGYAAGGTGGNSGQARYISGSNFSGEMTVVVGGAASSSSLSVGWGAFSTHTSSGGGGAFIAFHDRSTGGAGQNGRLNSEIAGFWNNVPGMEARSGGGGGGGNAEGYTSSGQVLSAGAQGASFRGAGGQGQNVYNPDSGYSSWNHQATGGPWPGNAGYVVISYPI